MNFPPKGKNGHDALFSPIRPGIAHTHTYTHSQFHRFRHLLHMFQTIHFMIIIMPDHVTLVALTGHKETKKNSPTHQLKSIMMCTDAAIGVRNTPDNPASFPSVEHDATLLLFAVYYGHVLSTDTAGSGTDRCVCVFRTRFKNQHCTQQRVREKSPCTQCPLDSLAEGGGWLATVRLFLAAPFFFFCSNTSPPPTTKME